ncbi:RDD family protein [Psychroserpens sp. Hel_I_66]|uniref:RDD family protein n=1 Tax=Psychroserpens sp. Hel_I_66 TaxID=1250004 RepID=UPI00068D1042|nr:RDD family protein [Psychroserpens sp. Hel_I_66]
MKITHKKYPNHNLATENERGENLIIDFIFSSILGALGVVFYFYIIDDYQYITFKIKLTAFLVYLAVRFCYYLLFESIYSRTPGKFETQTKVVDKNGNKPNVFQVIIRSLSRFMSVLSGLSDDERAIHDMTSNTFVVYDEHLKKIKFKKLLNVLFSLSIAAIAIYFLLKLLN